MKDPLQDGQGCDYGPYCWHSSSLQSLNAILLSTLMSIKVNKVRVKQRTLCYYQNYVNKCLDVSKDCESYLNATILKKKATLYVTNNEGTQLRMNFTKPYIVFLLEEGTRG